MNTKGSPFAFALTYLNNKSPILVKPLDLLEDEDLGTYFIRDDYSCYISLKLVLKLLPEEHVYANNSFHSRIKFVSSNGITTVLIAVEHSSLDAMTKTALKLVENGPELLLQIRQILTRYKVYGFLHVSLEASHRVIGTYSNYERDYYEYGWVPPSLELTFDDDWPTPEPNHPAEQDEESDEKGTINNPYVLD